MKRSAVSETRVFAPKNETSTLPPSYRNLAKLRIHHLRVWPTRNPLFILERALVTADQQEPTDFPKRPSLSGVHARTPIGLRSPVRVGIITVAFIGVAAVVAFGVEKYFTSHIPRKGQEQRLVFRLEAPYGSVDLRAGADPNDVATVQMLEEDANAHNFQWSYGLRDATVGVLHIGIGTDEGMRGGPPVAMWYANNENRFSLATSNEPQSDRGCPIPANPFLSVSPRFSLPPLFYDFPNGPAIGSASRTIMTDAGDIPPPSPAAGTRIRLTKDFPMYFAADLGFGESVLNLSGLPLTDAEIETGASKAYLYSTEPNPQPLETCSLRAGLGQCTFNGISYLNAEHFLFHGAVGSYHLGFEGKLTRNLDAVIELGLGMCTLSIPATAARVQVFFDDGLLSSYSFSGLAVRRDGYATSPGFNYSTSPVLTLHLSSGAGKISVAYH